VKYWGDEHECGNDLENILDWARLLACQVRGNNGGIEKYRKVLEAREADRVRLKEISGWRDSAAFSTREKAAFRLCESMSLRRTKGPFQIALKEAKNYFNPDEMVRLALNILSINDWITHHSGSQGRILIAEDDPNDRDLLQRQLRTAQMEGNVIFVPDGIQAMAVVEDYRNGRRDGELLALFLDLRLPGLSGLEFLHRLRAMREMKHLPVIIMTSSNDPKDIEECRKLKVVSYVEKTVTFGSFSNAVANIFHQNRNAAAS
jgi:two-component system response regulator